MKTAEYWKHHYALCDPRIDDPIKSVFYVGRAAGGRQTPRRRFGRHLADAAKGENNYKCNKIREIQRAGFEPVLVHLPDCDGDSEMEMSLIASYRANGVRLTNMTDGGDGSLGATHTLARRLKFSTTIKESLARPEVKARHRAANRKAWANPEVRAKRSASLREVLKHPEVRAKIIAGIRESGKRPEVQERRSLASKAIHADPEIKVRRIASLRATFATPESKEKRSASAREALARPDVKAKLSAASRARWAAPEAKARRSKIAAEVLSRPEVKAKLAEASRMRWEDADCRDRMVSNIRAALRRRYAIQRANNPDYMIAIFIWASGLQTKPTRIARQTGLVRATVQAWIRKYQEETLMRN